jgi:predicted solute-binding protein
MDKRTIKVVKRSQREQQEAAAQNEVKKSAQQSARDMVTTVTGWVNEFQQRRRDETRQALKTLFADSTPRPSGI